jgi:hypothetical protein
MAAVQVRVVMAQGWERHVDRAVDRYAVGPLAEDIAEDAGRGAARDTGALRGSYGVVKPSEGVRHVGSSLEYADFVEFGTDPHEILPKNAKALWWPGAAHPVRRVQHPGTRAQPTLRPAARTRRERPRGVIAP